MSCVYDDIHIYHVQQESILEIQITRPCREQFRVIRVTMALYFFDRTTVRRGTEWPLC